MEQIERVVDSIKAGVVNNEKINDTYEMLMEKFFNALKKMEPYVEDLKDKSKDISYSLKDSKATVATTSIIFLSVLVYFLFGNATRSKNLSKGSKETRKTKKLSRAQKSNKEIQSILNFVEEEYVPQIEDYIKGYEDLSEEDIEYKYKYFEEMLLKELLKLDAIEVKDNEILRDNRKKVIKFIQDHQRRLDTFMKEIVNS